MALYIVATPIGNLKDITLRALEILQSVDFILCEDKRVSLKLLARYNIKKKLIAFHQHSADKEIEKICGLLKEGKNIALITDAGTPGISDPGGKLIERVYEMGLKISPVPGPSAVCAALSISGFRADEYLFLGFPPHKKRRNKFFERIASYKNTCVIFEAPHRLKKTLSALNEIFKRNSQKRKVVICRELTKKFEEIIRGDLEEVLQKFSQTDIIKGEFTVVIGQNINKKIEKGK